MDGTNWENWSDAISVSFSDILDRLGNFIPTLVGAVVLLIIGWLVGVLLEQVVDRLLRAISAQKLFDGSRIESLVQKTGSARDTSGLLAGLIKWITYVVFFMAAAQVLHLDSISDFLSQILSYMPNVIAAVSIILIGGILAQFLSEVVRGAVSAASLGYAGFLASMTRWALWIFAILAGLAQLGVATGIINTVITGLVAALAISVGLAFGLGGQKNAAEFLDKVKKDLQ